jgi:glycosyltransferase involved in cell wall biosynthesis
MHIFLISVTYYPDQKSASFMLKTLAEDLINLGHEVTVLTFSSSIRSKLSVDIINQVKVIRLSVPDPGFSKIKRALIELSYSRMIISFLKSDFLNNQKKIDAVLYYSPSIFFGKAVNFIKNKWSIDSYLIVRDLFPDWLVKIGQMKKGIIYYFFKIYERKSFLSANTIGVESIADISYAKNIIKNTDIQVEHLLNWFSVSESKSNNTDSSSFLAKDKINLIYGGSLGLAQDLEGFLSLLSRLDSAKKLRIIIIGSGEKKDSISNFINQSNLDIKLIPMMERAKYLDLVSMADGGLVCLDKNLEANNYPGKSFDYMHFSKPLFCYLNTNNEFGTMVKNRKFGYVVEGGNLDSLDKNLKLFIENLEIRNLRGSNAKNVLADSFSVRKSALQIESAFNRDII